MAMCKACGHVLYWRAFHGARLADQLCPRCQGSLGLARWNAKADAYEFAVHRGKGKVIACPICYRNRRSEGPAVRRLEKPIQLSEKQGSMDAPATEILLPVGTVICWYHGESGTGCRMENGRFVLIAYHEVADAQDQDQQQQEP